MTRNKYSLTALAAGFISICAQSLIARELIIGFLGNELVIGSVLGSWLLWTGIGSILLGRRGESDVKPGRTLMLSLAAVAFFLPASFLASQYVRDILGLTQGEIAGPLPIIISCLAVLAPVCLFNGAIFPTLCHLNEEGAGRRQSAAYIFMWEALGSAIGGICFGLFIVPLAQPALVVQFCSILLVVLAARQIEKHRLAELLAFAGVVISTITMSAIAYDGSTHLNTVYGRTTITTHAETTSVFESGLLLATFPPAGTAESLVHMAMLQVDAPQRVLVIGGLIGLADEVLKYHVAVDFVELDSNAIDFVGSQIPRSMSLNKALSDGRAHVVFEDARRFIARFRGQPYDVIILNMPSPLTAQTNRYYTSEFFEAVSGRVSNGGVLAFSLESTPSIATPELRDFIASIRATLQTAFPNVEVTPGDYNIFIASKDTRLTLDPDEILKRLEARRIETKSFASTIGGDLQPFNVEMLRRSLAGETSIKINSDYSPSGYFQALAVWSSKERQASADWLTWTSTTISRCASSLERSLGISVWTLGAGTLAIFVLLLALIRPHIATAAGLAVAAGGFAQISVEIIVLLAFQVLFGYVYAMLGIVLSAFMIGLFFGGMLASRVIAKHSPRQWLLSAQCFVVCSPMVLLAVINIAGKLPDLGMAILFVAVAFIAGAAGGFQFPLAVSASSESMNSAAKLSALDLVGAAAGAIVLATFLLPTLGFGAVCILLSILGIPPLAALLFARSSG